MNQPMMVMKEHDPNDDPFAGLYSEEPILVSPMDFGSGEAMNMHKPSTTTTTTTTDEKEEAPSGEESSSESSTDEASSPSSPDDKE
jgi:hypothetical protein